MTPISESMIVSIWFTIRLITISEEFQRFVGIFGAAEKRIHAFISCRLYYCHSLLYDLLKTETKKLQRVAALFLTFTIRRMTTLSLYWCPCIVEMRIDFKYFRQMSTNVYLRLHLLTFLSCLRLITWRATVPSYLAAWDLPPG